MSAVPGRTPRVRTHGAAAIGHASCPAAVVLAAVVAFGPAAAGSVRTVATPDSSDSHAQYFGTHGYVFDHDDEELLSADLEGVLWRFGADGGRSMLLGAGLVPPSAQKLRAGGAPPVADVGIAGLIAAVPEPAMMTLLFAGLAALISALRRRGPGGPAARPLPEPRTSAV